MARLFTLGSHAIVAMSQIRTSGLIDSMTMIKEIT